ncbi:hypothetical protein GCM10010156_73010 [Planobispora rosea]|uniref:Uncharacterized protein n=1 Tax=Planobispora rosea TaxID=35762 RepID=A0A8J3SA53_PLARO|nr:hypothetical protein [Planobispora rosea]GGT04596.1 hypothetical protein GCM10010156_73010 [Planobispora rosea]GIH88887.1 hypothetical protein Pro02_72950 [Planobispora rosea]
MTGPRIISTTGELAAAAAGMDPATPVVAGEAEVEIGADLEQAGTWALVAEAVQLPADESGQILGPGQTPALIHELSPEGVTRRLAGAPALLVRARLLAVAGQLGEEALPADPAVRRAEALAGDGDMRRFLMELVAAVDVLSEEIEDAITAEHQPLSPAACRRLRRAVVALEGARTALSEAGWYGNVCELARQGIVDDDQECDPHRYRDALVVLPSPTGQGPGYEEAGCVVHAAEAVARIRGAHLA